MSPCPRTADSTRWGRRACTAAITTALGIATVVVTSQPAAAATTAHTARDARIAASHSAFADSDWGDPSADNVSTAKSGDYDATKDPGSLFTIEKGINVRKVWEQTDTANRQVTGQGVGVALLDSGANPVDGLDSPGKLVQGPDLSIESNSTDLSSVDTFGHGTHLAGIIAANDGPALTTKSAVKSLSKSAEVGIAPDATIEALKLATTDGSTDVSQVIAALDWVTQHPTLADGTRIRVVNLAFGTDSAQAYQSDPLAAAAENAWKHGLVVVVSGGNEGPTAGRLTDPAIDPYVIAVGASDSNNKTSGWNNPSVASFSSGGTAQRHVDLLAPGTSVTSLRSPGSFVDINHPEGLVDNDPSQRLLRGSGTSQAAAVVSGAVALLLQAYPNLTPDQVKAALTTTATKVAASPLYAGSGQLDVLGAYAAAKAMTSTVGKLVGLVLDPTQRFAASTGQGSLDAARGDYHLTDVDGAPLDGEVDVQGQPWNPQTWWAKASSLTAWQDGSWNGAVWTGSSWASTGGWDSGQWSSARWSSARWSSARWSDADWDSARWSSARWSSARWSSARWSSARWSESVWGASP